MARARLLKPSFFTSSDIGGLPMGARLLFQGLWCVSDREGRVVDDPRRLKVEILPYDKVNADKLLDLLQQAGLIERFESGGKRYIQVVNFLKHQTPHVREPASTIPAPGQHSASTGLAPLDPVTVPVPDPDPVAVPVTAGAGLKEIEAEWFSKTGQTATPFLFEQFEEAMKRWGTEATLEAIAETGKQNARSWKYTKAILERWASQGRDSPRGDAASKYDTDINRRLMELQKRPDSALSRLGRKAQ